jgi:carboxylesterase
MPFVPSYTVTEERRAYTFLGGSVGCLILHGFMGSPISSRPLARYLSERGISVHCPLLPGHGEFPDKLQNVSREAWIAESEEGLDYLRQHCDEIFLLGHSMGTILCAHLAVSSRDVRGMVMLAPVFDVPDRRIRLLRFIRYVMPWFYPLKQRNLVPLVHERLLDYDPTLDLQDPVVKARLPEMTRVPTSGINEMRKVVDMGRTLWPRLRAPVIVFQGVQDVAVNVEDTKRLFELLSANDKQLRLYEKAGHELMRPFEPVHAQVWSAVLEFVEARSSHDKATQSTEMAGY